MINQVILMGRLTREPEIRTTRSGRTYIKFSLAINEGYGENQRTDFANCIAWGKTAEFIGKYFKKGSMIIVEGKITTASWEGDDGKKKYDTGVVVREVKFGESKKKQDDEFIPANQYDKDDMPFD